jgi:hypothetical protein
VERPGARALQARLMEVAESQFIVTSNMRASKARAPGRISAFQNITNSALD